MALAAPAYTAEAVPLAPQAIGVAFRLRQTSPRSLLLTSAVTQSITPWVVADLIRRWPRRGPRWPPSTAYSNASRLIRAGECMAMGEPVVCYDLTESRFTAGAAACVSELLDEPDRRVAMGATGRERIVGDLSSKHAEHALLAAHDRALDHVGRR